MTVAAFVGPSLTEADRARFAGVCWLPPAEAGDLLRLDTTACSVICLIDGFFDHRPAVRHKEILLLLSRGVRIYGASSIGALRAAEMDQFGMIGVGAIYRSYLRGTIKGDDEVALVHGPAEWDWRPLSIPMVDLRATVVKGLRCGRLCRRQARALIAAGEGIHYVDRTWEAVAAALPEMDQEACPITWLKKHEVARKNSDALLCIKAGLAGWTPSPPARPAMVWTVYVDALARDCGLEIQAMAAADRRWSP